MTFYNKRNGWFLFCSACRLRETTAHRKSYSVFKTMQIWLRGQLRHYFRSFRRKIIFEKNEIYCNA